jgi:hypothetical protein
MDAEDIYAPLLVRPVDQYLAIEAAGAQQRRVENLGSIGRRQVHEPAERIETVHLDQELIERLLLLVVAAWPATAFASSVLPVLRGPTSRTPLGMRPPSRLYCSGFCLPGLSQCCDVT